MSYWDYKHSTIYEKDESNPYYNIFLKDQIEIFMEDRSRVIILSEEPKLLTRWQRFKLFIKRVWIAIKDHYC